MLIDWFTVGAQAVNFLVLLWLMKRYLYTPILSAIDAREKHIASELAGAVEKTGEAERARLELSSRTRAFDAQKDGLLAKAAAAAAAEHDRLLAAARQECATLRLTQQTLLQGENLAQTERIRGLVTDEVFSIARHALSDLADMQVEQCMVVAFVSRLRQLPPADQDSWIQALTRSTTGGIVRSRFGLALNLRALVQTAVDELCRAPVPLRFETAAVLVAGMDLTADGRRLSWNVTEYLQSLQERMVVV